MWFDDVGMAVMVHSREFHAGALQWDATVVDDSELSSYRIVVVGVTPEQLAEESALRACGGSRTTTSPQRDVRVPASGRGHSETAAWPAGPP